jgi:hypothetical protein
MYIDVGSGTEVITSTVVGTHSAFKTTTVNTFQDNELTEALHFSEPYGVGLMPLDGEQLLPVVTVAEAGMYVSRLHKDPSILAKNYTYEHQVEIERFALFGLIEARDVMQELLYQLHTTGVETTSYALILGDRGPLDGKAYAPVRTPEDDKNRTDMETLWGIARAIDREMVDLVFVSDIRGIKLEVIPERMDDEELRRNIDDTIRSLELSTHPNGLIEIHGSPEERHSQILQAVIAFATQPELPRIAPTPLSEIYHPPFTSLLE